LKNVILWDKKPCNLLRVKTCLLPASAGFLLGLIPNPEDGGDMFFQNIG
jgi:hypothetical protein